MQWKEAARLGPFSVRLLAPARAARVTFGVLLPLVVGWQSGHIAYGAFMALGALPAGFASFQGATRSRLAAVVVASIGMTVSTFVGAVAAASEPWSLVPIVAAWGYLTGLCVCLGPRWSVAVLQWSVALLIAVGLPQGPSEAAWRAGLVLAGGLLQTLLVAASWTLRPGRRERAAFAVAYRGLASYASAVGQGIVDPPAPTATAARAAAEDPNPLLANNVQVLYIDLVEEAERVRASLAALAVHVRPPIRDADGLRVFMAEAAVALTQLAAALEGGGVDGETTLRHEQLVARLTIPENAAWRWSGEALLAQLHAVARMIDDLDMAPARDAGPKATSAEATVPRASAFASSLALLRANMTTTSEAGRHALRLALVAALAEAAVQASGLYEGRWATLTIFLVLKPDYASTVYRGFQRALGTAVGAAAGALAVELAHHSYGAWIAVAGAAIAIAYAVFDASYLVFAVFLTIFIVVLLVMIGLPAVSVVEARIYETFIGAAAALIAYIAWPTWERTTAAARFARLVDAHAEYASALLGSLAHAGSIDLPKLRELGLAAGRARSDAEAAATRLAYEPAGGEFTPDLARLVMAPVAQLAQAELALHTMVLTLDPGSDARNVSPEIAARIDELMAAIGSALRRTAEGLRRLRAPSSVPALRQIYSDLETAPTMRGTPLVSVVDHLIEAASTLDAVVRTCLPA